MEVINCKIDVTKITKDKLFKGEKGTYLNCTLVPTPNGQYGDFMIVEDTTKEERKQEVKGAILGNGKKFQRGDANTQQQGGGNRAKPAAEEESSELPF